jgi:hypothetical protein
MQATLDPFLPGGWMEPWLQWVAARSPDYVEKKLDVWKIIGSLTLNTAAKVVSNVEPVRTGNMTLGLTGPSGSVKSWALQTNRLASQVLSIPAGTPDYLLTAINENRVGIIYEPEIGSVLKMAESRGGYMRAWGDLMDKIYDLDVLEAGRKTSVSVFVPAKSYYVSVMTAGTPRDYMGMFNLWPGLRRRFFMLNMEEVAPPKVWKPSSKGAEALAHLHAIIEKLQDVMVVLLLENIEAINSTVEAMIKGKLGDENLERKLFEYSLKMLYAVVVDRALPAIVGSVSMPYNLPDNLKLTSFNINNNKILYSYNITDDSCVRGMLLESRDLAVFFENLLEKGGITQLSVVSVDCQQLSADLKLIVNILNRQLSTVPTIEAPVREYAEFAEDVKELAAQGYTTLRDICRRRNWTKEKAQRYLESMQEAGTVTVRRIGKTTFVFTARFCGACRRYGTAECRYDPNGEGFVKPLDEPPEDGCFEPLGGE